LPVFIRRKENLAQINQTIHSLHCTSSYWVILQYRMCGFIDVPRQLQNINNTCHHLARNLNDDYEKQGSVCSSLKAMFYATRPADHDRQKRHFKLWLFCGSESNVTDRDGPDICWSDWSCVNFRNEYINHGASLG